MKTIINPSQSKMVIAIAGQVRNAYIAYEDEIKAQCIAWSGYLQSLNKTGYPRNPNGTMMDSWQLYDYYLQTGKRDGYVNHAKKYTNGTDYISEI